MEKGVIELLAERYKTCSRCVHDGEGANIAGSTCYLCKRNPIADNRIDWFEEEEDVDVEEPYDFSGWVIRYDIPFHDGRRYLKTSINNREGGIVPLMWNHLHNDPDSVLGSVRLSFRDDGIFVYGTLRNYSQKSLVMNMLRDRGSVALSPFVMDIKWNGRNIASGRISEVSLVPERIDPHDAYYPVLKEETC